MIFMKELLMKISLSDILVDNISKLEAEAISTPIYRIGYNATALPWMRAKQLINFNNFHSENYSWIDVADSYFLKTKL